MIKDPNSYVNIIILGVPSKIDSLFTLLLFDIKKNVLTTSCEIVYYQKSFYTRKGGMFFSGQHLIFDI